MELRTRSAICLSASIVLVLVLLAAPRDASAFSCATPTGDPFDVARQMVAGTAPWQFNGLLVGTITRIERSSDGTDVHTLVVAPEVVFAGPIRSVVRLYVGANGPEMGFSEGSRYFLVLDAGRDPAGPDWIVNPCLPSMEFTSAAQLQELRDLDRDEVVIREPRFPPASVPAILIASIVALAGWRLAGRRDRPS